MALVSPGVEVTIIDQSQYVTTAAPSVPLVVLATAQNKANAAGTGVAVATTKGNANKLYQVTSQRDLVNLFGNPFFYKTSNGTSIHGYELNEYGLMAAYSVLGVTNTAYILRADIDLASFVGQVGRPSGAPANGSTWLDTVNSTWGITEWNATTGKFSNKTPFVLFDSADIVDGEPLSSIGNIGSYAVIANPDANAALTRSTYFYKNKDNVWVAVGSQAWKESHATVVGSIVPTGIQVADSFTINVNNEFTVTIAGGATTLTSVVNAINAKNSQFLSAAISSSGRLEIYLSHPSTNAYIELTDVVAGSLLRLGVAEGVYYQPEVVYGNPAAMPMWGSQQTMPHPTGSVWVKVGTLRDGTGLDPVVSQYVSSVGAYVKQTVKAYVDDYAACAADTSGGLGIAAGTQYFQHSWGGSVKTAPLYFWTRAVSGQTVVTGTSTAPVFSSGDVLKVRISIPGTSLPSSVYTFPVIGTDALSFVESWQSANIPYTEARVTTSGAIQLVHTSGGVIELEDLDASGLSNGIIAAAGFTAGTVTGSKTGSVLSFNVVDAAVTGGTGTNAELNVTTTGRSYSVSTNITTAGTGYVVGDDITVVGTSLGGTTPANDLVLEVVSVDGLGGITEVAIKSGVAAPKFYTALSNWVALVYTANEGAPMAKPANGTPWYFSVADQVDVMVNFNGAWRGYKTVAYDAGGNPIPGGTNSTDAEGVIVAASEPTVQTDGVTALAHGDLWLDTSDLENYPMIYRWEEVEGVDQWVLIDKTDQVSNNGIIFADARWGLSGDVDPVDDPLPSIQDLLQSDYVDVDCPDPDLYPQGMLLFNTRRSGYNVKEYRVNYFNGIDFPDTSLPNIKHAWVSASGLKSDGSAYMGRKAQRNMVVQALKAAVQTNMSIREEDTFFNLIVCPGYPELQPDMVTLNNDRNNTAYIIGDTPLRLSDQATEIQAWARNENNATATGEDGLVTRDEYMGIFYPSGISTDLTGAEVVVPASHMVLRTFLRNDQVAYPWFAAAGTRRGTIDNASNLGFIDRITGEFQVIKNRVGIRDVLYTNMINPLAYFTNVGLLNWGNKNSRDTQSAMDRTNVSRLVCYIRDRLQVLARPFVFEPNDSITRAEITGVVQSLLIDLVAKRGVYDYLVVCDESNNTPARIDRNELWVDVAIEPVKAAEFIYIPVRIMNTGEIGD